MKRSPLILALIFPFVMQAQEDLNQIDKMIKTDDLLAFEKYLAAGNDLNDCYEKNLMK